MRLITIKQWFNNVNNYIDVNTEFTAGKELGNGHVHANADYIYWNILTHCRPKNIVCEIHMCLYY